MKEINFNKIKNQSKQILNILAKKASLFFLFLIIFYFILGGILIYKYDILAQRTEILDIETKQSMIKESTYQEILEHWDIKKIKFNEINETIYSNPFIEKTEKKIDEEPVEINEDLSSDLSADLPTQASAGAKEEAKEKAPPPVEEKSTAELFFGKINNLFEYYTSGGKKFLSIDERAKIWEQEGMGNKLRFARLFLFSRSLENGLFL
jgi:hypothetical protein